MPRIGERTRYFTESVIRRMTRVANEAGAINLSQGFPDFDPPMELMNAGGRAGRHGPHQYAVTWGAPAFREALARTQQGFRGIPLDPDRHLVVTCGATEAMMASLMTVCDPGDEVIVFSPFYENYGADAILTGARPLYVPLSPPDYRFDEQELARAFQRRPRALVLCNPSNPSGRVFTRAELECIARLAEEHDSWVVTDEVYEHIVYEPFAHTYFASLPRMFDRTLSCSSLSKTFSITGWRLGYVIGPEEAINGVRKAHDFLTVGAAAPLQEAAVTALNLPPEYYAQLRQGYTERRDVFLEQLSAAGLPFTTPQGAYYVMADISELGCRDDTSFCEWMAREVGVAGVPGSSFFSQPVHRYVRFHFAKQVSTLVEAGRRLRRLRDAWAARSATA
ncbi:MAG TPA: aminotransferase class I/II-fold pyridoxal phosphate-dependent enzyme [Spirochaetia bacterium]|nr:aminotransferase class I/II-fold pyridoxal phosphate-dependent enzyme [Spirochaetia bacterium]HTZ52832.1 aminotransferase class I/II-fold pyridoxal phosphate-dependent enzyme [Spirochaetia bacterium]